MSHGRDRSFGPQEHPFGVNRHDPVPVLFGGVLYALTEGNASVINQDVQLPIAADSGLNSLSTRNSLSQLWGRNPSKYRLGLSLII